MSNTKKYWVEITKEQNDSEVIYKKFECDTIDEVDAIIEQYSEDDGYGNYYGTTDGSSVELPTGYMIEKSVTFSATATDEEINKILAEAGIA